MPRKPKRHQANFRLTKAAIELIKRAAKRENLSQRKFIELCLERYANEVLKRPFSDVDPSPDDGQVVQRPEWVAELKGWKGATR